MVYMTSWGPRIRELPYGIRLVRLREWGALEQEKCRFTHCINQRAQRYVRAIPQRTPRQLHPIKIHIVQKHLPRIRVLLARCALESALVQGGISPDIYPCESVVGDVGWEAAERELAGVTAWLEGCAFEGYCELGGGERGGRGWGGEDETGEEGPVDGEGGEDVGLGLAREELVGGVGRG